MPVVPSTSPPREGWARAGVGAGRERYTIGPRNDGHPGGLDPADVDPDVDVRLAAEPPAEPRPLKLPVVPDLVAVDVAVAVERQETLVQAAILPEAVQGLLAVLDAERVDQGLQDF